MDRRAIPAVESLLQHPQTAQLILQYGRPLVLECIRFVLADMRSGAEAEIPPADDLLDLVTQRLEGWLKPSLLAVINATGVILHTNLGRAPLSDEAVAALVQASCSYSTLEFDLELGERGSRSSHVEELLLRLTGAEAALVVNNNAAAVQLVLAALANRRRAVISRTQLVEIGGGFRIPDVMAQSGAKLVEVGATNRVHLADYEDALAEPAALLLRAHPSNYKMIGFTSEVGLEDLASLAHRHNLPLLDDLGSGALLDTARFGLAHEPTVQESLKAGADVVCFSGDKLLGGPQAGIILGRRDLLAKIKKHPLARTLRADKLCLAALAATLRHYLKDEAEHKIPVWRMISMNPAELLLRVQAWKQVLEQGEICASLSTVGGGSLPGETLPTYVLAFGGQPNRLLARLRAGDPPVVARIENERVVFDPRTVFPEQEAALLAAIQKALNPSK